MICRLCACLLHCILLATAAAAVVHHHASQNKRVNLTGFESLLSASLINQTLMALGGLQAVVVAATSGTMALPVNQCCGHCQRLVVKPDCQQWLCYTSERPLTTGD
jgi:hypothetical protein